MKPSPHVCISCLCTLVFALSGVRLNAGEPTPATTPPRAKADVPSLMRQAQRFFEGYRFVQAYQAYGKLVGLVSKGEDLEKVLFFRARCLLELAGTDRDKLMQAVHKLEPLAENRAEFERPVYDQEARFWIGWAYLKSGDPGRAAATFRDLSGLRTRVNLDANARWYHAKALRAQAQMLHAKSPQERAIIAERRNKLRREAIQKLTEISFTYPQSPHAEDAELDLIQLRMDLREYADAAERADAFLKRPEIKAINRARALLYRAQCAYWLGELDAAIRYYQQLLAKEKPDTAIRLDAQYGLGWSLSRIARTASREQAIYYRTQARRRMQRALASMAADDPRRQPATHILAEVLVDLGEYKEALDRLKPLLASPAWQDRAHYLAGKARRGRQEYQLAVRHFEAALQRVRERGPTDFLIAILKNLAELESDRGSHAEALLYYEQVGVAARQLRDHATVAASELGIAKALVGLGERSPDQEEAAGQAASLSLIHLLVQTAQPTSGWRGAVSDLAFRLGSLERWSSAGLANYDQALTVLTRLRQRYRDRVREDELSYWEGQATFLKAEAQGVAELVDERRQVNEKAVGAILKRYDDAAAHMLAARTSNPRGLWAPKASFARGQVYAAKGHFALRVADHIVHKRPVTAKTYRDEGKKMLQWALEPFTAAIKTAGNNNVLRSEARLQLGVTYFDLEEYARAAREFQSLANDPDIPETLRVQATRQWARALNLLNRTDEAVARLRPDVGRDLKSAILAGQMLESLHRPRDAYNTYLAGLEGHLKGKNVQAERAAEAIYRAYSIALTQADAVVGTAHAAQLRQTAQGELRALADRYPATPWASRALLRLGEHLLAQPDGWRQALSLAKEARLDTKVTGDAQATLTQAVEILEGRALLAGGQPQAASAALRRALAIEASSGIRHARHAAAVRELGNAALAQGRTEEALNHYGDVFAKYYDVEAEADLARVATATILADRWQEACAAARKEPDRDLAARQKEAAQRYLRQAHDVLDKGQDRRLMLETQRAIEKRVKESP